MSEAKLNLPFTGIPSFMRAPIVGNLDELDADIAILGVPSDEGSPWYPGARMAPRQIREMSVRYAEYGPTQRHGGYYDLDEDRRYLVHETKNNRIVDCGDVDIVYTNPEQTMNNVTRSVRKILDSRRAAGHLRRRPRHLLRRRPRLRPARHLAALRRASRLQAVCARCPVRQRQPGAEDVLPEPGRPDGAGRHAQHADEPGRPR